MDEEYQGKVKWTCPLCEKPFESYIRNFLSRGPARCDCGSKVSLEVNVRKKASELGNIDICHIDDDRQEGKVRGVCQSLLKFSFEIFFPVVRQGVTARRGDEWLNKQKKTQNRVRRHPL